MSSSLLPIEAQLPQILASLRSHPRLVLEAATGAGKTTCVPPALLGADWLHDQRIIMLEPRRLAARAAAQFIAHARGETVGQTVGYRIRFEHRVSPDTRIEIVTEGILTRLLQDDPSLQGIGAIIFDEFHERHLSGDLGVAMALDVQATLRPELRLLLMSATLERERIEGWFDAPRIAVPGRSHPVTISHPPAHSREDWRGHLRRAVSQALAENAGDVLVFLPGRREIDSALRMLTRANADAAMEVLPLHGGLGLDAQQRALQPGHDSHRRVILATNVAESSVTLPNVRAVIDGGLAREPRFDPNNGFTRLETVNISQAAADQRAGRAGRLAPGAAYRLWPESRRLQSARSAEIAQVELSSLALELAGWGNAELRWLDAPPSGPLAQARELLQQLGALDKQHHITARGRRMLELGTEPRLAAAVLRTRKADRSLMADLLALLEARTPLRGESAHDDDFRHRLDALHAWRRRSRQTDILPGAMATIDRTARGWRRRLKADAPPKQVSDHLCAGNLLLPAFPDRVARCDAEDPRRYRLANGRGARLREDSMLAGEPWLLALDLRPHERDSLILSALPFDDAHLRTEFPQQFSRRAEQMWNARDQRVEAFSEERFGEIVLQRREQPPDTDAALALLLEAMREAGIDSLDWSDRATQLRKRIGFLRKACPECDLPDVSDASIAESMEHWLGPYLTGKTRLEAVDSGTLDQALTAMLSHAQRREVDAEAPNGMRVPSGRTCTLQYEDDQVVLAVKLQEMFGLAETPSVARGRVPVTLHLLSPAGRPIQVTRDLHGFWERTYPEVKKELKGRYPKHPWPEDPWTAQATARSKRRRPH